VLHTARNKFYLLTYLLIYLLWTQAVNVHCYQEQAGDWEQERADLTSEMNTLKERNDQLTSELNLRSLAVEKLKNKV